MTAGKGWTLIAYQDHEHAEPELIREETHKTLERAYDYASALRDRDPALRVYVISPDGSTIQLHEWGWHRVGF